VLLVGGWIYYLLLAGTSYLVLFVWQRARFHPAFCPDFASIRAQIVWSIVSVAGNVTLMMPVHLAIASGHSQIYFDVGAHAWWWLPLQLVGMLVVTETLVYWIHRALHRDWLYSRIHATHHSFVVPTPFTGVAFHPLDSFMQAAPMHLCAFLFPIHIGVYLGFVGFITAWAVMIHDRTSFMPWRGINYTGHHTLHHWLYDCNFGQFFTLWDRICGTYRDPETITDVPKDVLTPHVLRNR
jgi:Delta7-sterol 5-desaturase